MPKVELPYWLQSTVLTGREGDDDNQGGDGGEGDNSQDDDPPGSEGEGGEGDPNDSGSDDNVEGLKRALAEERSKAKRLDRENKRLKRKQTAQDDEGSQQAEKEQQDLQQAQKDLEASNSKVAKLAQRLLNNARDNAITAEARRQGFIDPTDALTDDIRNAIDIDQDDEDPSDIDIDETSVTKAVRNLANKKKHLVGAPNSGEPSGGRFRKGGDSGSSSSELEANYPSLR